MLISAKQTGNIVVNRNTHNIITKTHTHTPLKAVDFGFRTKRKDKPIMPVFRVEKVKILYDYAKHPLTQSPVIPTGKRIALSNAVPLSHEGNGKA